MPEDLELLAGEGIAIGTLVDIVGAESTGEILAAARAKGVHPRAAMLQPRPYSKLRTLYLGLPPTALAATIGATGTATVKTTNPIKVTRFVLPRTTAAVVNVTQIAVGSDNQILNAHPLPGDMFAPDSFDADMSLDTLNPAIEMYISFANLVATAITINGGFKGEAARS